MRLPDLRKILREDVKTKEQWVSAIIDPINSFMNVIYIGFNKNITFSENIRSIIKEVTVVAPSTYPSDQSPIKFPNIMSVKATGLWVIQAYEKDTYLPVLDPVYAARVEDNGVITVSGVSGLSPSKTYMVRFLVI